MSEAPQSRLWVAVHLLRCDQWVKNVFVFGALIFGKAVFVPEKVEAALVAFALFSAVTSAAYIHNDISDLKSDRLHPRKRRRPIASGAVSIPVARVVQVLLLAAGLGGAAVFQPQNLDMLVAYFVLNLLYSGILKQLVLLDVMCIAIGFVMRVLTGCEAVNIDPSVWILLCTFVLALFLGLGKRRHELLEGAGDGVARQANGRATYGTEFLEQAMGIASAVTIVCYAVFTAAPETKEVHGTTKLVYTVPFVVYGMLRYQWLLHDAGRGGDPGEIVATDRPLQLTILSWILTCGALLYWQW